MQSCRSLFSKRDYQFDSVQSGGEVGSLYYGGTNQLSLPPAGAVLSLDALSACKQGGRLRLIHSLGPALATHPHVRRYLSGADGKEAKLAEKTRPGPLSHPDHISRGRPVPTTLDLEDKDYWNLLYAVCFAQNMAADAAAGMEAKAEQLARTYLQEKQISPEEREQARESSYSILLRHLSADSPEIRRANSFLKAFLAGDQALSQIPWI